MKIRFVATLLAACLAGLGNAARAELNEIRIAQQYGISYLPTLIMENQKLVEKHAKAAGLDDVKVTWAQFAGANVMNDALLSGTLDIASAGASPAIIMWAKTHGEVKLVAAMNSMPNLLNTRNPNVKSIRDLTDLPGKPLNGQLAGVLVVLPDQREPVERLLAGHAVAVHPERDWAADRLVRQRVADLGP